MEIGSVHDQPRSRRPRSARNEENQEVVEAAFAQKQRKISRAIFHRLLKKDIVMYP